VAITSAMAMRRLCELSGWTLTNLEVQKLLYFAQMIALGKSKGRNPMTLEHFEAWDLGPVLPSAYRRVKVFGNKPIPPLLFGGRGEVPEFEEILKEAYEAFGHLTASQLVAETHWKNGAWSEHYRPGARGIEIPNEAILKEYQKRTAEA
jgi:uncharacterized phage-associated protein